jgi:RND family efflux transporter MFP subunit
MHPTEEIFNMSAPSCPSRETLLQYSIGLLSNQQSDDLAGHLESCPDCQATITTLEDAEDTLIGRLRTPSGSESCLAEPQFQTALAEVIDGKGVRSHLPERPEGCFAQMATDPFSPPVPFSLGEYQILEELGRGGMGRVYKALHTKLDREVAIKVLPRARLEDRQAITRFEREMKAVGRLAHPNIVQAHDAREIDGTPVLIMEFVDGLDLAEIVHRVGPLGDCPDFRVNENGTVPLGIGIANSCELVRRTALALQCAHEHGLVHRDIKLSNIMLTRSGEVKLLDLGLARFYAETSTGEEMTGTGQAMGTADYMAPEQASDSRTVDIRADIYSLGCTLYKLLSGRAPFGGPEYRGTLDKLNAHVHQTPPPIRQLIAEVPEDLSAIIDRMLAKDPADRFATPAEVAKTLEPLCAGANMVDVITRALTATHKAATVGRASDASDQPAATIQTATNPAPLPFPARRRWIPILIVLMLASMATGFTMGIIIRINKDGKETAISVPEGSSASVRPDGDVNVKLPGQEKLAESAPEGTSEDQSAEHSPEVTVVRPEVREVSRYMQYNGRIDAVEQSKGGSLYVGFDVPQHIILQVRRILSEQKNKGETPNEVRVLCGLADEKGLPHSGTVESTEVPIDPKTGTAHWRAALPNPEPGIFMPGMNAFVKLIMGTPYKAHLIPKNAPGGIDKSDSFVYVLDDQNVVHSHTVKFGQWYGSLIAVDEGLTADDRVVVSAANNLKPGMTVKPVESGKTNNVNSVADLRALQGYWRLARVEKGEGADLPWIVGYTNDYKINIEKADHWDFNRSQLVFRQTGKEGGIGWKYTIDPTASPKTIDIGIPGDSSPGSEMRFAALGIYEIDGDQLRICLARYLPSLKTEQRPKTFSIEPDSNDMLFILERIMHPAETKTLPSGKEQETKGTEANNTPPKIRFKYNFALWKDVLKSFTEQAHLSLVMDAPPPGTFNYTDDKEYTINEAIDLLNRVLLSKGYALVRQDRVLTLNTLEKPAQAGKQLTFRAVKITRSDIMTTVSATGTIEPAEVVDVTAQVSGRIVSFGDDPRGATDPEFKGKPIDYNSPVDEGTVLARIDDAIYKLKVDQEKAAVNRAQAELALAKNKYEKSQAQEKAGLLNAADQVPKAIVDAAEAAVEQSKAAMEQALTNLDNTVIKSPVKGAIVARRINVGQNVGPDPKSGSLFLIAKDLKNMQIWASVNEADIGRIKDGMTASFTVDAFPNEKFTGKVVQIRKDAQRIQNAVVYTVILAFDNSDLKLMPYMTANVKFEIDARKDVLLVPNAALRWKPSPEMIDKNSPIKLDKQEGSYATTMHGDITDDKYRSDIQKGLIWVKSPDGGHVFGIFIQFGLTDGALTEISGTDVKEGMEVVVGQDIRKDADHCRFPGKTEKSVFLGGWSVTDADLEHLQGLNQLESLNLSNANVTDAGLECLNWATQLNSLNLTFTKVTDAGLEHIKGLTNLQSLSLHGIGVTDAGVERLKTLTNLRELSLYNTAITDAGLEHLKGLTKLQSLDLGATKITGAGLKHISGLAELQSLNLIWTQLTDAGLDYLEGLSKLQSLNLWSTKVTDTGLVHLKGLTQLQSLELGRSKVTDAGLEHLKGLTQLQSLGLAETKVTDEGVKKLQQALPNCKIEGKNARVDLDSRKKR